MHEDITEENEENVEGIRLLSQGVETQDESSCGVCYPFRRFHLAYDGLWWSRTIWKDCERGTGSVWRGNGMKERGNIVISCTWSENEGVGEGARRS